MRYIILPNLALNLSNIYIIYFNISINRWLKLRDYYNIFSKLIKVLYIKSCYALLLPIIIIISFNINKTLVLKHYNWIYNWLTLGSVFLKGFIKIKTGITIR